MSLVTVIIPTYNRAQFLREALHSAVKQTYQELEILVLDDASPDATASVAAEFANDPRIQYIRHSHNLGIAGNWREGIEHARGEFFCLLHDDDTFEPMFVETNLKAIQTDPGLILSFCDHWVMDEAGNRLTDVTDDASRRFRRDQLQKGPLPEWAEIALVHATVPIGATLFRRSLIDAAFIDERAKGAIDMWLFYQCVKSRHGGYYTAERLMNYRSHGGGMSRSALLHMSDGHIFRCREILKDPQMAAIHSQIRRQLSVTLASQGIDLLVESRQQDARQSLQQSLELQISKRGAFAYALAHCGSLGTRIAHAIRSM